jgi:NADPH2:quinone reductase
MTRPFQVVEGGLDGLEKALKNSKDGKASGVKYVFEIEETEEGQKESRI